MTGRRPLETPEEKGAPEQGMPVPDIAWYYEEAEEEERLYRTGGYPRPYNYRILLH